MRSQQTPWGAPWGAKEFNDSDRHFTLVRHVSSGEHRFCNLLLCTVWGSPPSQGPLEEDIMLSQQKICRTSL